MREPFPIGGQTIDPGTQKTVELPLSVLSDHTKVSMPVHIMHGRKPGPVLFVSAAIHGDEILGAEIIRRLVSKLTVEKVRGTLLLIPIVNTYGFIANSRYLPDRRDLNRSFPGSKSGSLAGQLAYKFMEEIVSRSDYGIDLHTAAIHRENLPQIRADLASSAVKDMAAAFGAPIILKTDIRDGSLREAAQAVGVNTLLYEAGEALRFNEFAVRIGVKGVMRVMQHLGMLHRRGFAQGANEPVMSKLSLWVRAPSGGLMRLLKGLGDAVEKGEVLSIVSAPLGHEEKELRAPISGIIIGRSNMPAVNQGDAIFHIAKVFDPGATDEDIQSLEKQLGSDPLFDTEIV
ncbi:succinylglutamate desuccinylase/aspartoacylase family protein [Aquisalinus flavus]|uniref:Deacylase n=1 Tax=Aquisalinus flavus TaxID=1526572 RepID=A0A8J2V5N0_9PROT|nr:succinylglutamate desuccinylase/aspartoacylase family protein [Aquisalinus flavus]MBD0427822.1 succinylglutamate desuccinylase/aspartoacylase family protein [Aquisalinus flavus]UNE47590.1 succinylglutamate desuccinylase [Aquisalinus flavus]GGD04109.1 deacylase [Aquisalinus flavus]